MSDDLVEVYSATNQCEEDGCHFAFRFENCLSEDEAILLMTAVATTHYQTMHPDRPIDLDFEVHDMSPYDRHLPGERLN